jgi:hypothetical protein
MDNQTPLTLPPLPDFVREGNPAQAARHDKTQSKLDEVEATAKALLAANGIWTSARLVQRWVETNEGVAVVVEAGWFVDGAAGAAAALNGRALAETMKLRDKGDLQLAAMWRYAAMVTQSLGIDPVSSLAWERALSAVYTVQHMDTSTDAIAVARAEGIIHEQKA